MGGTKEIYHELNYKTYAYLNVYESIILEVKYYTYFNIT